MYDPTLQVAGGTAVLEMMTSTEQGAPLGVLQVLEGDDGVLRQALLARHGAQRVDALRLSLAHAKQQHVHLRAS